MLQQNSFFFYRIDIPLKMLQNANSKFQIVSLWNMYSVKI